MECGIVATCAETTCVQRKGNKQVGSEPGHWEGINDAVVILF